MIKLRQDSALPLSEATYCILAALAEPRHGYAIKQEAESRSEGNVRLGPGTLATSSSPDTAGRFAPVSGSGSDAIVPPVVRIRTDTVAILGWR